MANNMAHAAESVAIYWDFENLHANLVDQTHGPGAYQANRFRQQDEMINVETIVEYALSLGPIAINRAFANWVSFTRYKHSLLLMQTLPGYRQSAQAYRHLVQEGFVGELAANDKSREALEKEQDLKVQEATVQSLRAAIAQSEQRMASLRSQYRSQLENERMETLAVLNRSGQDLEKARLRVDQLEIRAPNAGVVKDLATTTRGAVVAAGALLMNIVPQNEPLQAEVQLKNEDMGFVAVGQAVRVKVAAYPFQTSGPLEGRVALVSADAADPGKRRRGSRRC